MKPWKKCRYQVPCQVSEVDVCIVDDTNLGKFMNGGPNDSGTVDGNKCVK